MQQNKVNEYTQKTYREWELSHAIAFLTIPVTKRKVEETELQTNTQKMLSEQQNHRLAKQEWV